MQQLLAVRRPQQAEQLVRRHLAQHPQDPFAHVLLALALLRQQRFDETKTAAKTALSLNPAESEAYYLLSLAQAQTGQPRAAEASIGRALQRNPLSSTYLGIRAWVLNLLGRPQEAQAAAEMGLRHDPAHAECLVQLAQALCKQEQWGALSTVLHRLVKAQPQLAVAHRLLGQEALRQEQFLAAQTHFGEALRLAPEDSESHQGLTRALRYSFGPGRAMRRIDRYLTFISEGTRQWKAKAWGHFLLILLPLSFFCIPLLLFMGFEALYWRLHPRVRQVRNRPAGTHSYLRETLYRYGAIASELLLILSLLPPVIWGVLWIGLPENSLGPGLTGGLTVLVMAMGGALKSAAKLPAPDKLPLGWLLTAGLMLTGSITACVLAEQWPWGPLAMLVGSSLLLAWRVRSTRQQVILNR